VSDRPSAVAIQDLVFGYYPGREVLRLADLTIAAGERVFLHGPSGSGKTTLLGLTAGVLNPTAGRVSILGQDLAGLHSSRRDAYRGSHIGYLFQLFNLIPYLSVLENIALPCRLHAIRRARIGQATIDAEARRLAERLELGSYLTTPVTELSVGQQQRVAAARALIGAPELVIADEPTSALDADLRDRFLELLFECCAEAKATLLFVSHDLSLGTRFDRVLSLPTLNTAGGR
jgi:putative ABC transport system ATP-binding protein